MADNFAIEQDRLKKAKLLKGTPTVVTGVYDKDKEQKLKTAFDSMAATKTAAVAPQTVAAPQVAPLVSKTAPQPVAAPQVAPLAPKTAGLSADITTPRDIEASLLKDRPQRGSAEGTSTVSTSFGKTEKRLSDIWERRREIIQKFKDEKNPGLLRDPEYLALQNEKIALEKGLKDEKGGRQAILEAQGYDLEARPYEFDEAKFSNPYLADQLAEIERSRGVMEADVAGMAGPQAEFRGAQSNLVNLLMDAAEGKGPSVVDATHRKAIDEAIATNRATSVSSGLSPAMAARAGIQATGKTVTEAAGDAAILKSQEQQKARTELASASAAARAGDLTLADNQQKYLQAMNQYYLQTGLNLQLAEYTAQQDLERLKADQHNTAQQTKVAGAAAAGGSTLDSVLGGISSFGGAVAGAFGSDIDLKENIEEGDKDVSSFLDKLVASKFNYKGEDKKDARIGIMAQDMEKSKMGKKAVIDAPNGFKAVAAMETLPILLASVANLNKRLKKVEE